MSFCTFDSLCHPRAPQVMATVDSLDKETGLFGIGEQRSAVVNDTILHIPYCTGDVHAGEKFRCCNCAELWHSIFIVSPFPPVFLFWPPPNSVF